MKNQRFNTVNELRRRIIQCQYKPGSTLDEKEICKEFGISRTPYREALMKLETEGLVEINPKKGVAVAGIDVNSLKDVLEMRFIAEKASAQMAFRRIQPHHLKAMKDVVDKIESLPPHDFPAYSELDAQYHSIIYDAQGNQILKEILSKLREQCLRLWNSFDDQEKFKELRIASIRDTVKNVYNAFVARDLSVVEEEIHKHSDGYLRIVVSHLLAGVDYEFNHSPK